MIQTKNAQDLAIERFWDTVPPLWNMVRTHIRSLASGQFDITVEQFHVLRYARRGSGSMSELAKAKNISRPAISQAVDVLVKKGLLARVQSTQDRRFVDVALTPQGDQLLDELFSQTRAWMRERMKMLSTEELDCIAQAMTALKKMLDPESQ
jgi:DNA-binding MarR family transcriptional regulator